MPRSVVCVLLLFTIACIFTIVSPPWPVVLMAGIAFLAVSPELREFLLSVLGLLRSVRCGRFLAVLRRTPT